MYGKIFDSIYDGTLRANWKALITFQQFIILADRDGVVDMTPHAIHGRTGIPLDIIEEGIKHLSEPDPYSRSSAEDGRRIIFLDPARPWGWRLVNHAYYLKLITREDKRQADRERIAGKREQEKLTNSGMSQPVAESREKSIESPTVADVAHEDVDVDVDVKKKTTLSGLQPDGVDIDAVHKKQNGKNLKAEAREILSFLNEKAERNFEPVDANLDLIVARLKEGFTPQQMYKVIARQCRKWLSDEKMHTYCRPKTLFNKTNFANYAGELGAKEAK